LASRGGEQEQKFARTKTGKLTKTVRAKALVRHPGLAIEQFSIDGHSKNLILMGVNSIRAEVLDMVAMVIHMQDKKMNLSHAAVESFFTWIIFFGIYLERYMFVDEDTIMAWIIEKEGPIMGKLKESYRILMCGKIQKRLAEIAEMQAIFPHSLPAGERIGRVALAVDDFAVLVTDYMGSVLAEIPALIDKYYKKTEIDKAKRNIVKYVLEHVGSEDFLVLYTRWLNISDLREWKMKVLMRVDFKYRAYSGWEKDMSFAHLHIASKFADSDEFADDDAKNKRALHEDFLRNRTAAQGHKRSASRTPSPAANEAQLLTESDSDESDIDNGETEVMSEEVI
jgi:hypothetical protein